MPTVEVAAAAMDASILAADSSECFEADSLLRDRGVSLMEGVWTSLLGDREPEGLPESSSGPISGSSRQMDPDFPLPLQRGVL